MATWFRLGLAALLLMVVWAGSPEAQVGGGGEQPRFTRAANGVISDHATGLDWYVCPNGDSTWHQAKAWAEGLSVDGGGWRLPTMPELKAIYQPGASANNMDPAFQTTVAWAWSGQLNNDWSVWGLAFYNGVEGWHSMNYGNGRLALAVRSHR